MRVRLSVHRHALPTTQVIWPIVDSEATVAGLLEKVNEVIPLESLQGTWGLEDYIVQLDGSELLHFSKLGDVVNNNDHITIRPLTTVEVRQRRLGGRDQISTDGKHLRDGIPFGRPWLKTPSRPDIRIPPRKRRRLLDSEDDNAAIDNVEGIQQYLTDDAELVDALTGSMEIDEESTLAEKATKSGRKNKRKAVAFNEDPTGESRLDELLKTLARGKTGEAEPVGTGNEHYTKLLMPAFIDDDEDDDDFAPDEDDGSSEDSFDEHASAEEDSEPDTGSNKRQDASLKPIAKQTSVAFGSGSGAKEKSARGETSLLPHRSTKQTTPETSDDSSNSESESSLSDSSALSSSSADESSDLSSSEESHSSDEESGKNEDEDEGKVVVLTNARSGKKSRAATTSVLDISRETMKQPQKQKLTGMEPKLLSKQTETTKLKPATIVKSSQVAGVVVEAPKKVSAPGEGTSATQTRNARRKKSKKLARLIKTGELLEGSTLADLDAREAAQNDPEASGEKSETAINSVIQVQDDIQDHAGKSDTHSAFNAQADSALDTPPTPSFPTRKLDAGITNRLIFGALGVRAPKNALEGESVRAKLAANKGLLQKGVHTPHPNGSGNAEELGVSVESDPNAWKKKLDIKAVECADEWIGDDGDDRYSAPPFPFEQFWDPVARDLKKQMSYQGSAESNAGKKKNKKKERERYGFGDEDELYDYGNGAGEGLQYDDADVAHEVAGAEDAVVGLDKEQLLREASTAVLGEEDEEDDMPRLPDDVASLQPAVISDLKVGAVIAFRRLEMSAATNWEPQLSLHKTAEVLACETHGEVADLTLKLAKRDRPSRHVEVDERGQRVYRGFEMAGFSDEEGEGEDGIVEVEFDSLTDVRVLAAAEDRDEEGPAQTIA